MEIITMSPDKSEVAGHTWEFKSRFRSRSFGWKSQPAIARIKQAVSEIKKVSKKDPLRAAEGAVLFLERISPAIEHVDGSSGSIGTSVNNAVADLVPIIANAPADESVREAWLERLFIAHEEDQMPYIESLTDYWGDLCASKEIASAWADKLVELTRTTLVSEYRVGGLFHGTSACLSAMFRAERYDELIDMLSSDRLIWNDKQWAAKALVAKGMYDAALRYAEGCRGPGVSDLAIDQFCEDLLLSSGRAGEAYERYALRAHQSGTYAATFRDVSKKYPYKSPRKILNDLVKTTPGKEGKWFAAAKDAGFYDEALQLASCTPCDPKTLARAARDFEGKHPVFAVGAGILSLHWLIRGYGYDITGADVLDAYYTTIAAADRCGTRDEVKARIRTMVVAESPSAFVAKILCGELGL